MADTAIDSSVLVAFLTGEKAADTERLYVLMEQQEAFLPPVSLSEVLSYPGLIPAQTEGIGALPLLPLEAGYWQRAGITRRRLLARGLKAHLPDALIAQACIDNNVPLLTRDADFRHYAEHCGLKLAP